MKINNGIVKIINFLIFISLVLGQFGRLSVYKSFSISLLDITSIVLFIFIAIYLIKNKRIKEFIREFRYFFIFFIIMIFSLILSNIHLGTQEFLISGSYIVRYIFYSGFILYGYILNSNNRKLTYNWLQSAIFVIAAIGIVQFVFYPDLSLIANNRWDIHLYRLYSVFLDPNYTGVLMSIGFILGISRVLEIKNFNNREGYLTVLYTIVVGLSVFLTYSRTALVVLIVGILILLLLNKRFRLTIGVIAIFMLLLVILSDTSVEGLNPFRIVSSNARIESSNIAIDLWNTNKLTGVGFNVYRYAQNEYGYRDSELWEVSHADAGTDNSYLFVLATTGVLGLGVFIILWLNIIVALFSGIQKKYSAYKKPVLSLLLGVMVGTVFLNILFFTYIIAPLYLLIGISLDD